MGSVSDCADQQYLLFERTSRECGIIESLAFPVVGGVMGGKRRVTNISEAFRTFFFFRKEAPVESKHLDRRLSNNWLVS